LPVAAVVAAVPVVAVAVVVVEVVGVVDYLFLRYRRLLRDNHWHRRRLRHRLLFPYLLH